MTLLPQRRRTRARKVEDEGRMSLVEHLRELRNRMFKAAIAIVLGMALAWIFYDQLFALLKDPFDGLREDAESRGLDVTLALTDVTGPFFLQLKISLGGIVFRAVGVQIWAFHPGLHKTSVATRCVHRTAVRCSLPAVIRLLSLPKDSPSLGHPRHEGVENHHLGNYLNFVIRMCWFSASLELPVHRAVKMVGVGISR